MQLKSGTWEGSPTQGGRLHVAEILVSVSVIVGVFPHVTATLVESRDCVVTGSGPITNAAAPVGGGVRLSRSDGRNPYWDLPLFFFKSFGSCRAGSPFRILSRSKTKILPAR